MGQDPARRTAGIGSDHREHSKPRPGPWEITDSLQNGRRRMSDSRVHGRSPRSGAEHSASPAWKQWMTGAAIFPAKWLVIHPTQMTAQRAAIFKPLGLELTRQMEAALCTTPEEVGPVDPPAPRPPEGKEVIESKIIPCERCGAIVNNASVLGLRPSSGFLFTVRTSPRSSLSQNRRRWSSPPRGSASMPFAPLSLRRI